jgi:diguanylate cyclase (GGDEF)-like protein
VEPDPRERTSDPLTGLLTRRAFWDSIRRRPDHWPANWRMGLAPIDLAGFRQFQHEHGHNRGDAALRCVAEAIPLVTPHEWACRYGGDEFGGLLAVTEPSQVEEWAETARARIAAATEHAVSIALGVQIGIAVSEPGWWPSDIFAQAISPADAALYEAVRGDPRRDVVVTEMWSGS